MIRQFIEIDGQRIGPGYPPYVVAELSANHRGSVSQAKKLIELAKSSGASAVKLQTYSPETMTIESANEEFTISSGPWKGRRLYDLYEEAQTPFDWHAELFAYAADVGITIFSSAFDSSAIALLEQLHSPAYKIASFEIVDIPLIEKVSRTGKPVILSTGMANKGEISTAVEAARESGCKQLALLHCTSAYPAPHNEMNLNIIPDLYERFRSVVGLSDHTLDLTVPIAGVALGASIIEKHFIEGRLEGGPDAGFSLEPAEFAEMAAAAKRTWESLGKASYAISGAEQPNRMFRRSIYVIKNIAAGERLSEENIRIIRPGLGLPPKYWKEVLGKTAAHSLKRGTALDWKHVNN